MEEQKEDINYQQKEDNVTFLAFCMFGFILGMIVMISIFVILNYRYNFWIPYQPVCVTDQYINNPSRALIEGYEVDDILFIDSTPDNIPEMKYKRPVKSACTPGSNQTIHIKYPQFCNVTIIDGTVLKIKDEFFEANRYRAVGGDDTTIIETSGDCVPITDGYADGEIVLDWI